MNRVLSFWFRVNIILYYCPQHYLLFSWKVSLYLMIYDYFSSFILRYQSIIQFYFQPSNILFSSSSYNFFCLHIYSVRSGHTKLSLLSMSSSKFLNISSMLVSVVFKYSCFYVLFNCSRLYIYFSFVLIFVSKVFFVISNFLLKTYLILNFFLSAGNKFFSIIVLTFFNFS